MQYTIFPHQDTGRQIGIGLSNTHSCITERNLIFIRASSISWQRRILFFPYMKPGFREKFPENPFHLAMCPFLIFIFITHYFSLPESLSYHTLMDGSDCFRYILSLLLYFLYGSIPSCIILRISVRETFHVFTFCGAFFTCSDKWHSQSFGYTTIASGNSSGYSIMGWYTISLTPCS